MTLYSCKLLDVTVHHRLKSYNYEDLGTLVIHLDSTILAYWHFVKLNDERNKHSFNGINY